MNASRDPSAQWIGARVPVPLEVQAQHGSGAAIKGVNFHLEPGEKLAPVGPNGSGRTTLIKLLTRL